MADTSSSLMESGVVFPPEVQAAIDQVLPSDDPLDQPDLDCVQYINNLFPSEQSLNNLDVTIDELNFKVTTIDEEMREIVRSQTAVGGDAAAALEEAQAAIIQLFSQIRDIKNKASESEAMVKDITRDIKQLDTAKKNLTQAITTLNHLHMLVGGVATLTTLANNRQYGEAALLLQGLLEVLNHFSSYQNIPQIKELSDQVVSIKRDLGDQITKDFEAAMTGDNPKMMGSSKQLAEACLVVSVLEPRVKRSLISWFIQLQIKEYTIMFQDNEDQAWLDKIDRRYNWLKKHLIEFEERFGPMFPPDWEMSERIAVQFCRVTKSELSKILGRRSHEVDTKLLLHAIQKTAAFETLLSRRFTGVTLQPDSGGSSEDYDPKNNPFAEENEKKTSSPSQTYQNVTLTPFKGIISQAFEPYLNIYIEAQDRNLADLIERFVSDLTRDGVPDMDSEGGGVLPSCGDLFVFYKKCMVQCCELSTGHPMIDLTKVFKKYLREYASRVLVANLPKIGNSPSAAAMLTLPAMSQLKDLKDLSNATSGILQNFSSLLKEGDMPRFSPQDQVLICCFLVTAEYCLDTTQQLEEKLKQKVDPALAGEVTLAGETDLYHSVIGNCVGLLVQELEAGCEPGLLAMTRMSWQAVQQVGDQSDYVSQISGNVRGMVPRVRRCLDASRKYFTQFCIKFVTNFIPKFIACVYKCKPLSTVGAEQLLLDTHSLKTVLLDLPNLTEGNSRPTGRKAPAAFTKIVVKGMTRAEMILKVVMSPADPATFVEQYIRLVQDPDGPELSKLLDMKGLRRSEQTTFLDLYRESVPSSQSLQGSPRYQPGSPAQAALNEESRVKKLEKLIKKRL